MKSGIQEALPFVESLPPTPPELASSVFRPMQYLGSKLRSLPSLIDAIEHLNSTDRVVLDIFSGSSVVSQALAARRFRVLATDALQFCVVLSQALLGVGRMSSDLSASQLLDGLDLTSRELWWTEGWRPLIERERQAIAARDGDELIKLSGAIPQIWRPLNATKRQSRLFDSLANQVGGTPDEGGITMAFYAGTYFGVAQAAAIDELRHAIHVLWTRAEITEWQRSVLLAALLSATSDCVFSAGKHFAQPHLLLGDKDKAFHRQRILEDRSKDVGEIFQQRLAQIVAYSRPSEEDHRSEHATMEGLLADLAFGTPAAVIYADPPYTAQQYSRFYHVPETLTVYRVPELQYVEGKVTRGLYPIGRYKSRFSSKRQAPQAFSDLCRLAKALGCDLAISYSMTGPGSGNHRMIQLDDLLTLCRQQFDGRMEIVRLDHQYRQFNHSSLATEQRDDSEFLIVGRPRC